MLVGLAVLPSEDALTTTKTPLKKKAPGKYHHGELRRALVTATLAIVEREGTGAVSLSAAARRVGVSPQATYNHFRDKGELLAAAAEHAMRGLAVTLRAAASEARGPGERLEGTALAYVRFAQENVAKFRLLGAPELATKETYPLLLEAFEDAFRVLLDAIEEGQRAGVVRKGEARKLALASWATVHGIAHFAAEGLLVATGVEGDAMALARDAVRALFKGLRAKK